MEFDAVPVADQSSGGEGMQEYEPIKVAAVVVTYNRLDMLQQCLEHLESQTSPCDILVVNNACTDGTDQWLRIYRQSHGNVFTHRIAENAGSAGGFHAGMRWAVEAGYDGIWIMDDDCLPNADALEKLLEADELLQGDYGWLSSVVLWTDGTECEVGRQKLKKHLYNDCLYLSHGLVPAEQATFVSFFLRAQTIRAAGLPIAKFFILGDDMEYTRRVAVRMKKSGFVCGKSIVVHAIQKNSGNNIALDEVYRIDRYNYAFRNENYLYRQEGWRGFVRYTGNCITSLHQVIQAGQGCMMSRCAVILRQYVCGLFFNPKIEYIEEKK